MRIGKCVCCHRELHIWQANEEYPVSMRSVWQQATFQYAIEAMPGMKACEDCVDYGDVKYEGELGEERITYVSKSPQMLARIKRDLETLRKVREKQNG